MAARFPGANTVSAFWDNLRRGEESIVTLSEEDLLAEGISEKALANHAYVRRAALLDGIDEFDADFFGFTPQAARMTDPQHRLFLQTAWHAIEDAGYDPAQIDGSVGVYGTSTASGYLLHNLMSQSRPERDHRAGRDVRDGQPVVAERQGLPGDAGGPPVQPARPCAVGADRLFVSVGRSASGLPEHSEWRMRHGVGRRRVAADPAPRRVLARTRFDGVGNRPLPAVRRAFGWHDLRQRSRCGGAEVVAGRHR